MPNQFTRKFSETRNTGIYIAIVKDTSDAQKSGRLRVWIPELSSDPDDEKGWKLVNYSSPFAGATNPADTTTKVKDYEGTQQSYGFWMVPPDVGNHVLVAFASGRAERGYWIGCLYNRFMNNMVPAIAKGKNYKDTSKELPVAEYNKHEKVAPDPTRPDATTRPYHRDKTQSIAEQGLINDNIRGLTSSSARRESPSQVFGVNTPGPLESGKKYRKGGHSFVMDDHDGEEHITFMTRSGSQIRIDESNGLLYFINKKGTAWFQMDEDGNIDFFGAEDISLRAQRDFNIRADRNINIEAGQNIYMKAAKDTDAELKIVGEGAGQGGDIFIQALNNEQHTVKQNVFFTVTDGNLDIDVKTGNKKEHIGGNADIRVDGEKQETIGSSLGIKSSNYNLDSAGTIDTTGNIISAGIMYAQDFQTPMLGLVGHMHFITAFIDPKVHGPSVDPGLLGGGGASGTGPDAAQATPAQVKVTVDKTNILVGFEDENMYTREEQEIKTTVDRFPTFEPYPEHKNKGE